MLEIINPKLESLMEINKNDYDTRPGSLFHRTPV